MPYEIDTETLEGQIELQLVLPGAKVPYRYRCTVRIHYEPSHVLATSQHMDGVELQDDDDDLQTAVEVFYCLLPEGIALADLEDAVRPKGRPGQRAARRRSATGPLLGERELRDGEDGGYAGPRAREVQAVTAR